jgi:two-component system response regulator MprA
MKRVNRLRRRPVSRPRRAASRRATLLLVEDDPGVRALLSLSLGREGYRVIEAADGEEALRWLGPGLLEGEPERLPDAIVADVNLPGFSGLDIAECVDLLARPVPVVLITGSERADVLADAERLAHAVLRKPFDLDKLRAIVRAAVFGERARPAAGAVGTAHAL